VVWHDARQEGTANIGVFGRVFDSGGAPHGSDFHVNTYTTGSQQYPVVTANATGSFTVMWESVHDATQFETRLYDVKKPKRLCAPVDKNSEGVTSSIAHLMCYQVKVAKGHPKVTPVVGVIHTQNQFGAGRLDTQKEEELCVPATKNL
jgi:hypothetical protein